MYIDPESASESAAVSSTHSDRCLSVTCLQGGTHCFYLLFIKGVERGILGCGGTFGVFALDYCISDKTCEHHNYSFQFLVGTRAAALHSVCVFEFLFVCLSLFTTSLPGELQCKCLHVPPRLIIPNRRKTLERIRPWPGTEMRHPAPIRPRPGPASAALWNPLHFPLLVIPSLLSVSLRDVFKTKMGMCLRVSYHYSQEHIVLPAFNYNYRNMLHFTVPLHNRNPNRWDREIYCCSHPLKKNCLSLFREPGYKICRTLCPCETQ